MKSVRIYKDNLREHILRSLFFSNNVIFLGAGIVIAVVTFLIFHFVLHSFQIGLFVMTVFTSEICLALITTIQIENQTIVSLIPRVCGFATTKKQYEMKDLDASTSNFTIIGNAIKHKQELIAIFEIQPYDIALLNEEDRDHFYHQVKMMLHTLPKHVQLIVRKETAKVSDYHNHFFSMYKGAEKKQEKLIAQYVNDISSLVETGKFQIMKYYAVFSAPLPTDKETHFVDAQKSLHDQSIRFITSLGALHINVTQLQKEDLIAYCKSQLQ